MLEASMIVIGDEILGGYVTDTSSPWLADRLREHGVPFVRIHVVPDDPEQIGEALQLELARARPRVIFTSGGIGSTPDDLTYEAIASALGRELVEDPFIAERIAGTVEWSRDHGLEITDEFVWHLHRMARIPAGSRLLLREGGWAPAVTVDVGGGSDQDGGASIVILPGVPSEFRALVTQAIEPNLLAGRNDIPTVVELEHAFPESALNTTFVEVMRRWPDVQLGSYPGRPMLVRLTGPATEVSQARKMIRDALDVLAAGPAGQRVAAAWNSRRPTTEEDV